MNTLQQYESDILDVAAKHGVIEIRVFGSFALGTPTSASDLDILVKLEPGRDLLDVIAMKQELEARIGRKVDITTEKGLSPYLREEILSQAKPI